MAESDFKPIEIELFDLELIPYVRMTQRSMHVDKYAKRYIDQQKALRLGINTILSNQGLDTFEGMYIPDKTPFMMLLHISTNMRMHRCDLDNLVKSALDLCQGIVYTNDSYCDAIVSSRNLIPKEEIPKVTISFYPWSGDWQVIR